MANEKVKLKGNCEEYPTGAAKIKRPMTAEDVYALTAGNHRCGWTIGPVKNPSPACGCMCGTVYGPDGYPILAHYGRNSPRCSHADERGVVSHDDLAKADGLPETVKVCPDCRDYENNIREWIGRLGGDPSASHLSFTLDAIITQLRSELAAAQSKYEHCKQQAEIWAQEARTQTATVHECYAAAGVQGKAAFNGAVPVRDAFAAAEAKLAAYSSPCGKPGHYSSVAGLAEVPEGLTAFCVNCEMEGRVARAEALALLPQTGATNDAV